MKSFLILLSLFFITSCGSGVNKPLPPDNLIPQKEMVAIVKDLILIEGHLSITYKQIQSYHKIIIASSEEVFRKHGITKNDYEKSFDYYAADQDKITDIYSEVLNELTLEKGKLE
jgi:hypothetical protein